MGPFEENGAERRRSSNQPRMNRTAYLLDVTQEECAETAHRASKAARFGLDEIQPGQPFSNSDRLMHEYAHLVALIRMLEKDGLVRYPDDFEKQVAAKEEKVERFLLYSAKCGILLEADEEPRAPAPAAAL